MNYLVIGIIIAIGLLTVVVLLAISTEKPEISITMDRVENPPIQLSEEDAIQIVRNIYYPTDVEILKTQLIFVKYNGTQNGSPVYIGYNVNPILKKIIKSSTFPIYLNQYSKELDLQTDKFVWIVTTKNFPGINKYFIDENTGQLIGGYLPPAV